MKKYPVFILVFLFGCAGISVLPDAIVEGKVTIAPLCGQAPNQSNSTNPCGLTDKEIDGIYANYAVILKNTTTSAIQKKVLDYTGTFSFAVSEGVYDISIESSMPNALKFSSISDINKNLKVSSGQKQYLEFRVNTGLP